MASITKRGACYELSFYYKRRRYRTSLGRIRRGEAERARNVAEGMLSLLKADAVRMPEGSDLLGFVLGREDTNADVSRSEPAPADELELTIGDLLEEYEAFAKPPSRAPSTYVTEMLHLKHFKEFLGQKLSFPAEDIGCRTIEEYKRTRVHDVLPDTVNKELQTLRQAFAMGVRHRYLEANPLDNVSRFQKSRPERRFLTKQEIDYIESQAGGVTKEEQKELRRFRYLAPDEVAKLVDLATGTESYPAIVIAAYTGMRRGELLHLEWSDIDFDRGTIAVRSRKGSRSRRYQVRYIDVHPALHEALLEHKKEHFTDRYVLGDGGSEPWSPHKASWALKKLVKGTEFEGIGFHALRHSFSSNLARAGVDDRIIDYYMGHQTEEMRRRYQHLFPGARRVAVRRLGY